jgi:hypothetical protein
MDILIKHENKWRNILEIFGEEDKAALHVSIVNNSYEIPVQLVEAKESINYNELVKDYVKKIDGFNKKFEEIEQKSQKDADLVDGEEYRIDLAFFYSEPKVTKNASGKLDPYQSEVSFRNEVLRIFNKLSNEHAIRSAKIEVQVATLSNLYKTLSKGVRILHFSCHGRMKYGLEIEGEGTDLGLMKYLDHQGLVEMLSKLQKTP